MSRTFTIGRIIYEKHTDSANVLSFACEIYSALAGVVIGQLKLDMISSVHSVLEKQK